MKLNLKLLILVGCTLVLVLWRPQNVQASTTNQKSPLAINVAGMVRWNTDWPLIDEMKRAEVVTQCTGDNCWNTQEHHKVDWDQNGWPRTLTPQGGGRFTEISYLLFGGAYENWGDVPPPPTGNFHVLYAGEGTLKYSDAASYVESCGAGCDLVKIETPGDANDFTARISITKTDPNNNGKYLKNIRVIWPGGLCNGDVFTYHASAATCSGSYQSFVGLEDQITFHPDYLNDLKRYKAIRFMDLQKANETIVTRFDPTIGQYGEWWVNVNEETLWADRRLPSYSVWSDGIPVSTDEHPPSRGAPIEVMVELLNVLGADGWFTVPFAATDDYVEQFALLVKENLNNGQKIYLEYGNEAWNYAFRGAKWIKAKGEQFAWSSSSSDNDVYAKQTNWFAKRTIEVCNLWKTKWAGDSDRVECVLGGQAANDWMTEHRLLKCDLWKNDSDNPKQGQTCASQVDALAIAPYFGAYIGSSSYEHQVQDWSLDTLFSEITAGGQLSGASETTAAAQLSGASEILGLPLSPGRYFGEDELENNPDLNEIPVAEMISAQGALPASAQLSGAASSKSALQEAKEWMSKQAALARDFGVDLLAYEGGQHLVGVGDVTKNGTITQLFRNANRDSRMGAAYTQNLNDWKQVDGKLFAVFDAVGPSNKSGSWGIKEYQNQSSPPKHTAVQDFINNNPCWWAGCDEAGVISYTLPDNQWQQIGLPRALPEGENTVAEVFGDDLDITTYNTNWAVYFYDTANGGYVNPGLDGVLQQGVGYWIIQKSGAAATLTLPSGSTTTPVTTPTPTQCPSNKGCFEIPLITRDGATGWNMLSHVFESDVAPDQLRVVTKSGSTCANGCTLEDAKIAGIVHNQFWRYDGAGYQQLNGGDSIKPWYGLWAAALDNALDLEPKLLIPAP